MPEPLPDRVWLYYEQVSLLTHGESTPELAEAFRRVSTYMAGIMVPLEDFRQVWPGVPLVPGTQSLSGCCVLDV